MASVGVCKKWLELEYVRNGSSWEYEKWLEVEYVRNGSRWSM